MTVHKIKDVVSYNVLPAWAGETIEVDTYGSGPVTPPAIGWQDTITGQLPDGLTFGQNEITFVKAVIPTHGGLLAVAPFPGQTINQDTTGAVFGTGVPGGGFTLQFDGVSNWMVTRQGLSTLRHAEYIYTHVVRGDAYSVATPWPFKWSRDSGSLVKLYPGIGNNDILVTLDDIVQGSLGYLLSSITFRKSDDSNKRSYIRAKAGQTLSGVPNTFPLVLYSHLDTVHVAAATDEGAVTGIQYAPEAGVNQCRVSATPGDPFGAVAAINATTLYINPVPGLGDKMALPTSPAPGTYRYWQHHRVNRTVALTLSDAYYGVAASPNSIHTVFNWLRPDGEIYLVLGTPWASANPALALPADCGLIDGVPVNAAALAGGVNAFTARAVAVIRTNSNARVDFQGQQLPGFAALPAKFNIWNFNNRIPYRTSWQDPTQQWTYQDGTWRRPNGNANQYLQFVRGMAVEPVKARYAALTSGSYPGTGGPLITIDVNGVHPAPGAECQYNEQNNLMPVATEYGACLGIGSFDMGPYEKMHGNVPATFYSNYIEGIGQTTFSAELWA